jgi:hypothetical protein
MLMHALLKGISLHAVALAHAVSAGAVIYAIIAVDGWVKVYTLLCLPGFVAVSYIFEKENRISFVQHMQLLELTDAAEDLKGLVSALSASYT